MDVQGDHEDDLPEIEISWSDTPEPAFLAALTQQQLQISVETVEQAENVKIIQAADEPRRIEAQEYLLALRDTIQDKLEAGSEWMGISVFNATMTILHATKSNDGSPREIVPAWQPHES